MKILETHVCLLSRQKVNRAWVEHDKVLTAFPQTCEIRRIAFRLAPNIGPAEASRSTNLPQTNLEKKVASKSPFGLYLYPLFFNFGSIVGRESVNLHSQMA